jgi:cytochrome c peroxidase
MSRTHGNSRVQWSTRDRLVSAPWSALGLAAMAAGLVACGGGDGGTRDQPLATGAASQVVPTVAAATILSPQEHLGKAIFFDANLSANGNQSCASCHAPEAGWTGPDSDINERGSVYEGSIPGAFGDRKPPSSAYATPSPILHFVLDEGDPLFIGGNFWDGRATGERLGSPAAEQAQGPFLNPAEQALPAASAVVARICESTAYGDLFRQVAGSQACDPANVAQAYDQVGYAIAAYEASAESNAFTSKFDHYLKGAVKLTQLEQQGLNLFNGKGKCSACHTLERGKSPKKAAALFTDFSFDNLGLPRNPENPVYLTRGEAWVDDGLGAFLASRPDYAPYAADNMGKHKVPTLRNVDKRPFPGFVKAYGHNGYFKSLEGIVHFYNTRDVKPRCAGAYTEAQALAANCWPAPEVAANVNSDELGDLRLTPAQEAAIVAFMKTLSDGYTP